MNRLSIIHLILTSIACFSVVSYANAGDMSNGCDVVSLNGTGTRLQNGAISGSEIMTIIATGEQIPIEFTAVPLGITKFQDGQVTFITSHDFKGGNNSSVRFTTFDKITTVPLEGDPSCGQGACGLVFKLTLQKGTGKYNCGQIVSGYDQTLTSFSSTLQGNTLQLNSVGKLCMCSPGRN